MKRIFLVGLLVGTNSFFLFGCGPDEEGSSDEGTSYSAEDTTTSDAEGESDDLQEIEEPDNEEPNNEVPSEDETGEDAVDMISCLDTGCVNGLECASDENGSYECVCHSDYDCEGVCGGAAECDGCEVCNGDGSTCEPRCGDGIYHEELNEACDDGNLENGDGCSSSCEIEDGFGQECNLDYTKCTPTCGDGVIEYYEEIPSFYTDQYGSEDWAGAMTIIMCDDGNLVDGDGCSSSCRKEEGFACTDNRTNFSAVNLDLGAYFTFENQLPTYCYTRRDCESHIFFVTECSKLNWGPDRCYDAYFYSRDGSLDDSYASQYIQSVVNIPEAEGMTGTCSFDRPDRYDEERYDGVCDLDRFSCDAFDRCGNGYTLSDPYRYHWEWDIYYHEECDDGNLVDGDGCDSHCRIEENFECEVLQEWSDYPEDSPCRSVNGYDCYEYECFLME